MRIRRDDENWRSLFACFYVIISSLFTVVDTEKSPSLLTKTLHLSCTQLPLSLKASSSSKIGQKISKKDLPQSKLNVRKISASKSKQIKQRNRGGTKLNIRTPVHTILKKNIKRYRKRRSAGCKTKFPRITSKTLSKILQF